MPPTQPIESLCINVVRGLAMDAVQKANSGHPGMPMGAAPMAHALWTRHLRHNPKNPAWFDRDRFVLSAGHGSMLLYALLHLTGYDLTLDDLKSFRQWGSRTPGHPERGLTPGVEMATGPLGQGIATAVGMAMAERALAARFNRPGHNVIDHFTYVVASDGDLMEGISQEACSLAGHQGLGKLVVLYDDNKITIDGSTELAFTEDVEARFQAMGWGVWKCDGLDPDAVDRWITEARRDLDRPSLVVCRTVIGYGSPNKQGRSSSHGAPLGPDEVALAKEALGLPPEESFWVPDEVRDFYLRAVQTGEAAQKEWEERLASYRTDHPELEAELRRLMVGDFGREWLQGLPSFDKPEATRAQSQKVINGVAPFLPTFFSGCADLAESVKTTIEGEPVMSRTKPLGRNIAFGVREHAMAAAVNGMTLHGGVKASGGTFLIFSDYCRPAIRLAALMHCPSIFVFSHDSVQLGEDGPTHQPVEQLMSLRAIPNLNVMRPADGHETAACWKVALEATTAPSVIVLTRQTVPLLTPAMVRSHPAEKGAYVLREASGGHPLLVIVATGSEVALAVEAGEMLDREDIPTRVVSMPSWFLFEKQSAEYRASVLPPGVPTVSVEAGATLGWYRYANAPIGLDRFGESAPGGVVYENLGLTVQAIVNEARSLVEVAVTS
ncbi:MAG: transketolase [Fimbriimonadaceae bacterium]|nr:transketolase [Fimbriimonadaceae bacterium]QYK58604.1 MAG: transketolase [Fimbriimonadaceae bacterium]